MARTSEPATLRLPTTMDLTAAADLASRIGALRGRRLALDASGVEHLGGLCLQVLLAAEASWTVDGAGFVVSPRSVAFEEALRLAGAELAEAA